MSNKIKKIVKHYVRESLMEIFAEMHLESIVEGVVNKQQVENFQPKQRMAQYESPPRPTPRRTNLHEIMDVGSDHYSDFEDKTKSRAEQLGISNEDFSAIYADTIKSNNPILNAGGEEPPEVPIEALESLGLAKDYSQYLPETKTASGIGEDEFEKLREQREKRLKEIIQQ